jgi:hypothetical protein
VVLLGQHVMATFATPTRPELLSTGGGRMGRIGTRVHSSGYGMGQTGTVWDGEGRMPETQKPLGGNARVGSTPTFGTTLEPRSTAAPLYGITGHQASSIWASRTTIPT